jgi:hypothetical protein
MTTLYLQQTPLFLFTICRDNICHGICATTAGLAMNQQVVAANLLLQSSTWLALQNPVAGKSKISLIVV